MATLTEALQRARAATTAPEDWCILRLDRNDRTLEIYWSEANATYYRTSSTVNSSGGTFRPHGGHAEMQLIRDFANVVRNYGNWPGIVEIFISRSPCGKSPTFPVGVVQYPEGCGRKLITLAHQFSAIGEWVIVYDEVFQGNRNAPQYNADAYTMIGLINNERKMTARQFNPLLDH